MLSVNWMPEAISDLADIVDYIELDNPYATARIHELLRVSATTLGETPYLGRKGRVAGTRERLAHPSYLIVYRINSQSIDILNIIHTKRQYP